MKRSKMIKKISKIIINDKGSTYVVVPDRKSKGVNKLSNKILKSIERAGMLAPSYYNPYTDSHTYPGYWEPEND